MPSDSSELLFVDGIREIGYREYELYFDPDGKRQIQKGVQIFAQYGNWFCSCGPSSHCRESEPERGCKHIRALVQYLKYRAGDAPL